MKTIKTHFICLGIMTYLVIGLNTYGNRYWIIKQAQDENDSRSFPSLYPVGQPNNSNDGTAKIGAFFCGVLWPIYWPLHYAIKYWEPK